MAGGSVVGLWGGGRAAHGHPAVRSILLAVGAGIAFSMSSVYTKTVAVDWSRHVSLADLSSLAAIGVFATAGMLLSQASYRGAGTTGTALALGCGVVAAGGLILLTSERISSGAARSGSDAKQPAAETETAPRDEAEVVSPADGPMPEAAPVSGPSAVGPVGPVAPVVPSDLGALTSLTASEASVRELLAGLPEQTGDDALYHPAPHSAAGIVPVPTTGPTGGTVLVPEAQPGGGTVLVPTPLKAPAPGVDAAAPEEPSARDELPYLTAMLGVPYVPMPFVNHHRTRVRS